MKAPTLISLALLLLVALAVAVAGAPVPTQSRQLQAARANRRRSPVVRSPPVADTSELTEGAKGATPADGPSAQPQALVPAPYEPARAEVADPFSPASRKLQAARRPSTPRRVADTREIFDAAPPTPPAGPSGAAQAVGLMPAPYEPARPDVDGPFAPATPVPARRLQAANRRRSPIPPVDTNELSSGKAAPTDGPSAQPQALEAAPREAARADVDDPFAPATRR